MRAEPRVTSNPAGALNKPQRRDERREDNRLRTSALIASLRFNGRLEILRGVRAGWTFATQRALPSGVRAVWVTRLSAAACYSSNAFCGPIESEMKMQSIMAAGTPLPERGHSCPMPLAFAPLHSAGMTEDLSLTPRFSGVWARVAASEPLQRFASPRETAEAVRDPHPHTHTPLKRGVNEIRAADGRILTRPPRSGGHPACRRGRHLAARTRAQLSKSCDRGQRPNRRARRPALRQARCLPLRRRAVAVSRCAPFGCAPSSPLALYTVF